MNWKKIIIFGVLIISIFFITLRCYSSFWIRQYIIPVPDTDSVNRIEVKMNKEMTTRNKSILLNQNTSENYVGEHKMYAIGIKNVNQHELKYQLRFTQVSSPSEEIKNADKWFIFQSSEFKIESGKSVIKGIGVQIPTDAEIGNYKFLVEVIENNTNGVYGQQEVDIRVKNKPLWQKLKDKFSNIC